MKQNPVFVIILIACLFTSFAIVARTTDPGYKVTFERTRNDQMNLNFAIDEVSFSEITINGTTYSKINFKGGRPSSKKGYAEVPIISSTVQLSDDKNGAQLPFIFSVACVNGHFKDRTCFAEAWLRKSNGGAVATMMSSIDQPWTPPMSGQDYMNDLLVGGHTYSGSEKGTNTDHGKTHFGAIAFNGSCLMLAENDDADTKETIESWSVFGDPSLQVRTDAPKALVISNSNVPVNSYKTNITVGGLAFANALVSVWDGTNQPFSGLTDASGNVTITHTLTTGSSATLTVTGFNLTPFIAPVKISLATSAETIDLSNALQIYPNPSNGNISLDYAFINNQNSTIKIIDAVGKVIYSDVLEMNQQHKEISLTNIENGIYFIQFENNSQIATRKIIIQN